MLEIFICVGSSCHIKGSYQVIKIFQELIKDFGLQDKVELKASFCLGHCTKGVSVKVGEEYLDGLSTTNAKGMFVEHIVRRLENNEYHSIQGS